MKKYKDYLIGIIFLIVGIVLLVIFSIFNIIDNNFKKDAIKTVGIIQDIIYDYVGEDTDIDVIISYQDSKEIKHIAKSNYYSNTMRIGDEITVYYKDDNPSKIVVEKNDFVSYIPFILSSLFIILGIVLIIVPILNQIKGKKLISTGLRLNATINSVDLNTRYQINGRSPYIIRASFTYNNIIYETKSNNIWYEVGVIIDNKGIKELPVYINTNNPKKNYLDTKELEQYVGK